jgi:hypothetical protein
MGMVYWGVPQRLALWQRSEAAVREFIEAGTYLADTAGQPHHFDRVTP